MNESKGPCRRKATDEMRARADELERQAREWRTLAARLDEIESHALAENAKSEGEGSCPYIGAGSQSEAFLWSLACGCVK